MEFPIAPVPDWACQQNWEFLRESRYETHITGDGSATQFTVTHGLGTDDVDVLVYASAAPKANASVTVERPSPDQVRLVFGSAPGAGVGYRVVVKR